MKSAVISANVINILSSVTLGIALSLSATAYADGTSSKASSITLAMNTTSNKMWNERLVNATNSNDLASKASVEALNRAMEEVSTKLEKQLEDKIARKMDYVLH